MLHKLLLAALLLICAAASAQPVCVCTAGCKIVSDPYPSTGPLPTICTVYKAGAFVNSATPVASNNISVSNASVCSPASATYNPGPAGSLSCSVMIPAQAAGTVTLTMTAGNATTAETAPTTITFISAALLPVALSQPANLRVSP